jgi:uncharacterized cupredoxin-like copper-binding protein
MRRTLIATLAALTLFAAPAQASHEHKDKAQLKLQKAKVKESKQTYKETKKLSKKWDRYTKRDKEDKAEAIEKELRVIYKAELTRLRNQGMPTVAVTVTHPGHVGEKGATRRLPTGAPKMEALRDLLVDLKSGDLKQWAQGNKMDQFTEAMSDRYERKKTQFKADKKA